MQQDNSFTLSLTNIHCASCVKSIESALNANSSVMTATVNFAEKTVSIKGTILPQAAIVLLDQAGYQAVLATSPVDQARAQQSHYSKLLRQAGIAFVAGSLLMLLGMSGWVTLNSVQGQWIWIGLAALTLAVMYYCGLHFFKGAWRSFIHHSATMDTLISLGVITAWVYSLTVCLFPDWFPAASRHVYFEASVMILAFINFGNALEIKAKGKTSAAIENLMDLQPKTATVIKDDQEEKILLSAITEGDIIKVRPGESVAQDGVVIAGQSTVDESMLTGESWPIDKTIGDKVIAGSINQSGVLQFKVSQTGANTALAHIIAAVRLAQNTKPKIAHLADVISSYFVPAVLILAVLTALTWFNLDGSAVHILMTSLSVLVIACPCALGLAAPISVMVGTGKAAQYGILIRDGDGLQKASQITTVVLDKTGTITDGKPAVSDVIPVAGVDANELLKLALPIESASEHPLAKAIVNYAEQQNISAAAISEFQAIPGFGVKGMYKGRDILLGQAKLMQQHAVDVSPLKDEADKAARLGKTPVYVACQHQLKGLIVIADNVKKDAKKAIENFKQQGLTVVMLTGDNQHTAQSIAKTVGIDKVFAQVLPHEKAQQIQQLQEAGEIVAMVGDGINDAPALTQADVGFALGAGTDIAMQSADVTLMGDSLLAVDHAMQISRATMSNIKQNLGCAFGYNILAIPIAAGVLYPFFGILLNPMLAGAAMAASSLTVVLNASRLRLFKIRRPA